MYRVPVKLERTLFMHATLEWILFAVCHADGAAAAAACGLQLLNLLSRESCTALLLMLLYVCMSYVYGCGCLSLDSRCCCLLLL